MTTKTFKQFLEDESSDLELMRYELFFRKEMNLSKAAAQRAIRWAVKQGQLGAPQPQMIPDDGWDHILDWADGVYREQNPGKSIFDARKGAMGTATTEMIVKALIARTMRSKYNMELMAAPISENVEELETLPFELAFRKEFGATKEQAKELVLWFKDEKDWGDLDFDTRGPIIDRWDPDNTEHHQGMAYSDHVMDEISIIFRQKFNLDTRDLV